MARAKSQADSGPFTALTCRFRLVISFFRIRKLTDYLKIRFRKAK